MLGMLRKMAVDLQTPVHYQLCIGEEKTLLNSWLGQKITLQFTGKIYCIQCGRKTAKSFQQGHCFPCYRKLLDCGLCTIHPEKCRYYEGICQPEDWAHAHCGQPQIVYLANSSTIKVGITRASSLHSRWIDQGATQGVPIFHVQNRHQAGLVEVALKAFVADKTHWQAMLKADNQPTDLLSKREEISKQSQTVINELMARFPGEIHPAIESPITINYPVLNYPLKINTLDVHKTPIISGVLQGIKGQYLLLDSGVISLRKFAGYEVAWGSAN